MKGTSLSLSLCLAGLMLLTACGGGGGGHTHTPEGGWLCDREGHRRVCADCGESIDAGRHTAKEGPCDICGCEVYSYEDGTASLSEHDAEGMLLRSVWYAPDGTRSTSPAPRVYLTFSTVHSTSPDSIRCTSAYSCL